MKGLEGIKVPTKESSEICPKHHVNYVYLKNIAPFCPKCEAEKIEADKEKQIQDFKIQSVKRVLRY